MGKVKEIPVSKVKSITRIEKPSDYENLGKENRALKEQVKRYQQLFAMNGITDLALMVDEYISLSRKRLKEIAAEAKLADFDRNQIQILLRLSEFLYAVAEEVRSFTSLYIEGKWAEHPASRRVDLDIKTLTSLFARKENFIMLTNEEMEEFHQELVSVIELVERFIKSDGDAV